MKDNNIRPALRRAAEEVHGVRESPSTPEVCDRLSGIELQLRHVCDRETIDPEAVAYPDPGALDTIDEHLAEIIEDTDDEAVCENLERACEEIQAAVEVLDQTLERQQTVLTDRE